MKDGESVGHIGLKGKVAPSRARLARPSLAPPDQDSRHREDGHQNTGKEDDDPPRPAEGEAVQLVSSRRGGAKSENRGTTADLPPSDMREPLLAAFKNKKRRHEFRSGVTLLAHC